MMQLFVSDYRFPDMITVYSSALDQDLLPQKITLKQFILCELKF